MFQPASDMDPEARKALQASFSSDPSVVAQSMSRSTGGGSSSVVEELNREEVHTIPAARAEENREMPQEEEEEEEVVEAVLQEVSVAAQPPPPAEVLPASEPALHVGPNPESASASPFTPLPSMPAGWYFDKIAGAPGGNSEVISILVVGNTSVGKTCFCRKFARESDVQRAGPTVGVYAYSGGFVDTAGKVYRVQLFDTQGSDRVCRVIDSFMTRCHAVLLVFDVTDRASFEALPEWKQNVCSKGEQRNRYSFLADTVLANKADQGGKSISDAELSAFKEQTETTNLYEISALEFDEDTLQRIVASVVQKVAERKALGLYESPVWNESGLDLGAGSRGGSASGISVGAAKESAANNVSAPPKKSGCC